MALQIRLVAMLIPSTIYNFCIALCHGNSIVNHKSIDLMILGIITVRPSQSVHSHSRVLLNNIGIVAEIHPQTSLVVLIL